MVEKSKRAGKEDPYRSIRRDVPPPGYPIGRGSEYRRDKDYEQHLIDVGIMEYDGDIQEEDIIPFWKEV
jgi:hypothetical protein